MGTTVSNMGEVERIERFDAEQFSDDFVKCSKPVIIKNLFHDGGAFCDWSPDSLAAKLGSRQIDVWGAEPGDKFIRDQATGDHKINYKMDFDKFIEKIKVFDEQQLRPYFSLSLPGNCPELMDDVRLPGFLADKKHLSMRLWVGAKGTVTSLHYDLRNNFLFQIYGKKRLVLFDPYQSDCLYPFPKNSNVFYVSQVDMENPDLAKHPKFVKANSLTVTIDAGETLFLPPGWWHQVYTLETSIGLAFWWENYLRQCFIPSWYPLLKYRFLKERKVCFKKDDF